MPDTIIQEIRKTRDEYARRFSYDLHAMCLDLRREQELSGATVVTFSTKPVRPESAGWPSLLQAGCAAQETSAGAVIVNPAMQPN